jgi:hypothetical protein
MTAEPISGRAMRLRQRHGTLPPPIRPNWLPYGSREEPDLAHDQTRDNARGVEETLTVQQDEVTHAFERKRFVLSKDCVSE